MRPQFETMNTQTDTLNLDDLNIQEDNLVIVNTENIPSIQSNIYYTDIVYANSDETITPRKIFKAVAAAIPDVIGSMLSDDVYLALLNAELQYFACGGSYRFNFLNAKATLNLSPGKSSYELPNNFDKMISVYIDRDCRLNYQHDKIEVAYLNPEQSDFVHGYNYYTLENNQISIINTYNELLDKCDHCAKCDNCKHFDGKFYIHYKTTPKEVENVDDKLMWFPKNTYAFQYIKEKMIEAIYMRTNSGQYISSKADFFYQAVLEWDRNITPISNKTRSAYKPFSFSRMQKRGF